MNSSSTLGVRGTRSRYRRSGWCLALISLGLLGACGDHTPGIADLPQLVDSVLLESPDSPTLRQFPGEVRADQRAELAFLVPGPLVELLILEGERVEAGELLARVDPRDFENVRVGRQADFTETRARLDRTASAFEAGAVSEAELDQARTRFEVAAAELALAEKHLTDTELRAPFSGRVARRFVDTFQNVQAGQPILLLEDISRLEIHIQLPEQDIVRLPVGVPTLGAEVGEIGFEALPGQRFPVSVKGIETRADPLTSTYRATFSLPHPRQGNILPGMSASFFPGYEVEQLHFSFLLPVEAVQATPDRRSYVWVLDPVDSTVQRRMIRAGRLSGRSIEVLEGLQPGDRVITSGAVNLAEGARVRMER